MTGALAVWLALAPAPRPVEATPPPDRWHEVLASPPACDIHRFPCRAVAHSHAWFAYKFRRRLLEEAQDSFNRERWVYYWHAYEVMHDHWRAWEWLLSAHGEYLPDWQRQLYLAELRKVIGSDAYDRGEMPESVPGHLFHDLKR